MKKHFLSKAILSLAAVFLSVVCLSSPARAQLTRGAIQGTVRDEAGAAVAGAQVKVSNPATNIARDATTNDEGFYRVGALEPGTYTVAVQSTGFAKIENNGVVVQPSLDTTFD